jgi:3-methylcrotonyl-CoA carboxylase alpha subunit/geranyl-CoA carboxylase alpha subunit
MVAVQVADGRWHGQCGAIDVWWRDVSHAPVQVAGARAGATELRAPFNGRVLALLVAVGQRVARGEALVVIESMKLEHVLSATGTGVVAALGVSVGQQASSGQLLITFEPPAQ